MRGLKEHLVKLIKLPIKRFLFILLNIKKAFIVYYGQSESRIKVYSLIYKIKNERHMLLGANEAYSVYMATRNTHKLKGDVAEIGVYEGASAKLICEVKGNKTLHLFDTFEGIPNVGSIDSKLFYKGQYLASEKDVRRYLKSYKNIYFYKGTFPETITQVIKYKKYSFVHIDVDTYKSTKDALIFFYPRMNKGGIILCHDYASAKGVKKAIDDFFKKKPEPIIEIADLQCLTVKI
jgi:hypothetical protein